MIKIYTVLQLIYESLLSALNPNYSSQMMLLFFKNCVSLMFKILSKSLPKLLVIVIPL